MGGPHHADSFHQSLLTCDPMGASRQLLFALLLAL
jgi:hypothetical protein